ncbi:MAG: hypothetical protein ACPGTQ_13950 [Colwellia sp.]
MEIQSAMGSGIEGFHKATATIQQSAKEINAQITTDNQSDSATFNSESLANVMPNEVEEAARAYSPSNDSANDLSSSDSSSSQLNEISQALVDLKVAEHQAKASAEVIKSADESLGTLLDVTA